MAEYPIIAFAALLFLIYGLFSKAAEKSVVTPPMVFVIIGIIASNFPVSFLNGGVNAPLVKIIAELALILVLFVDASTIDLKKLIKERRLPMRLLFIGLPVTMVLGTLIAIPLFPGINIWLILLMALILSPTDAALGQAVVTSELVPEKIRRTINVESGLNDGLALPPILVCLAVLAGGESQGAGFSYWGLFTLKQFIFGPVIGGLVGWLGGKLVDRASNREWMNHTFQSLAALAIAILAFALSEMVHGNGFIGAYFAGLMLGTNTEKVRERVHEFGEAESQAFVLTIFLLFGMILVPVAWQYWDLNVWIYAVLSLTVIRMLPVAFSLIGAKLPRFDVLFIGWFGPRGIASVLYLLLMIIEIGSTGYEYIISVIVLTVLLSILLHGLTAVPFSRMYGGK
ncbi:MAG: cation:proton antiporter [Ignavibacteria bacterium]|nr:cation:proton antiporter [Ignavibacteria bacterium]